MPGTFISTPSNYYSPFLFLDHVSGLSSCVCKDPLPGHGCRNHLLPELHLPSSDGLCQKDTHAKPTTQPELTRDPGEPGLERDQCLWLRAPGFLGNKDWWCSALEPRGPGTHNVPSFLKEAGETQSQSLRKRKLNHRPQLLRLLFIHGVNLSSVASNRGTQTHEHSPVPQLCSKASERSSRKFKERSPLESISQ